MKIDIRKHLTRLVLTALAAVLGSGVILGIVQANVQEWAKASGNDQYLVKYSRPIMDRLAEITSTGPFVVITAVLIGAALSLWADVFVRRWLEWYASNAGRISFKNVDRKLVSMTALFLLILATMVCGAWVLYEQHTSNVTGISHASDDKKPKPILTEDDRRFRYELRGFSLSALNDLLQSSAQTFAMLRRIDRERNEGTAELGARDYFIHFATSTEDFGIEEIKSALFPANAEDIDSDRVQELIFHYFQRYSQFQKFIAQLNAVLGIDLPKTEEMQRWLDADKQCRNDLQKLKAWPQAKRLRNIQDSIFASVDRTWDRPPVPVTRKVVDSSEIQKENERLRSALDRLQDGNNELKGELEAQNRLKTANVNPSAQSQLSNDSKTIQSLSVGEQEALSRDLYKMKSSIPMVYITSSGLQPASHDVMTFVHIFQKAGIQPGTTGQQLEGPDQKGLFLCVPDPKSVPEKVERLAEVLARYGIKADYAPLVESRISSNVPPEVGFVLFVGPK